MIQDYDGILGKFKYDDTKFNLIEGIQWNRVGLHYIGEESDIEIPEGLRTCKNMFKNSKYEKLRIHFNNQPIRSCRNMFNDCRNLTEIEFYDINTEEVEDMCNMFYTCSALRRIDLSGFNFKTVTDVSNMFAYCRSLEEIDLSNFNGEQIETVRSMFMNCTKLRGIDFGKYDFQNVDEMDNLLAGCTELMYVHAPNLILDTGSFSIFKGCKNLKYIILSRENYYSEFFANDLVLSLQGQSITGNSHFLNCDKLKALGGKNYD